MRPMLPLPRSPRAPSYPLCDRRKELLVLHASCFQRWQGCRAKQLLSVHSSQGADSRAIPQALVFWTVNELLRGPIVYGNYQNGSETHTRRYRVNRLSSGSFIPCVSSRSVDLT